MLWDAACSIRGEKDAPKFKDYELEGQLMGWVERLLGELQSKDIKIEHA